MKLVHPAISVWHLLLLIPAVTTAVTFRLEAENAAGPHTINWRSAASNVRTVFVISASDRLSFPFCLYRQVTADVTVTYSHDGGNSDVRVKVDNTQNLTFSTGAAYGGGANWNVFQSASFSGVTLNRGIQKLALTFQGLDTYGIEIDYVDVSVDDDFVTDDVFRCKLLLGAEPSFEGVGGGVSAGHLEQHSYHTPCPEEDNVHLAVYHDTVSQYTLRATNPLYRSMYDNKTHDTSTCPNLDATYWRFDDVDADTALNNVIHSSAVAQNNATLTGYLVQNDVTYNVKYVVTFDLKGFKKGFIDADIHSILKATFNQGASSSTNIKVTYEGRSGQPVLLDEFVVSGSTVTKSWDIPDMTWSEDHLNFLNIYASDEDTMVNDFQLIRGYMGPDQPVDIFNSDEVRLQGFVSDFWWRRPVGESLTVVVRGQQFKNLSRVALYVQTPWSGVNSYQQLLVLYQDGNVRLLPVPYSSPTPGYWIPFGTSVICGKSNPADLRPAAPIKTLTFVPETLEMTLDYYDGSTSKITLAYTVSETALKVTDMTFSPSTQGRPFASFRSMFVRFGSADSDSVQSELEGPEHVLGAWGNLGGREFLVFRAVESHHLTHSPDIRLTIEA
ncbi:uncharacterized protein [Littorina saxatilis]|uniref:Uncharacterized protein n=1 Tax=Littorina saxatilis TaxID=31220 RepID=A0AAN9B1F0_9CAEN